VVLLLPSHYVAAQSKAPESPRLAVGLSLQFVDFPQHPQPPDYLAIKKASDERIAIERAAAEKRKADCDADGGHLESAGCVVPTPLKTYTQPVQISYGNGYTAGQCTSYVASRVNVPSSMGNATNWGFGLAAAGWSRLLAPGSVGVGHIGIGHVVYVEGVTIFGVSISDMNYAGPFVITHRIVGSGEYEWFHQ
jgi:surface antigen